MLPLCRGADQLLQEERVPVCELCYPVRPLLADVAAEHLPDQLLARAVRQRLEANLLRAAIRPEVREELSHLRSREREHHERVLREAPEGRPNEADRHEIAPVEILEDEQKRPRRALCR